MTLVAIKVLTKEKNITSPNHEQKTCLLISKGNIEEILIVTE